MYPIQDFSQTEQEGGFWLINLKLPSACFPQYSNHTPKYAPLFDVNNRFRLSNHNETLCLFQHTPSNTQHHLQFLCKQPVSITKQTQLQITPSTNKHPIQIHPSENLLFLGSGLHIANVFYLAKQRSAQISAYHGEKKGQTLALLHSHEHFPFRIKPAQLMVNYLPPEAIGCCTLLEDWHITNRLASNLAAPGCFDGDLADLFEYWLHQTNQCTSFCEPWHIILCVPSETKKKCLTISQPYRKTNVSSIV